MLKLLLSKTFWTWQRQGSLTAVADVLLPKKSKREREREKNLGAVRSSVAVAISLQAQSSLQFKSQRKKGALRQVNRVGSSSSSSSNGRNIDWQIFVVVSLPFLLFLLHHVLLLLLLLVWTSLRAVDGTQNDIQTQILDWLVCLMNGVWTNIVRVSQSVRQSVCVCCTAVYVQCCLVLWWLLPLLQW